MFKMSALVLIPTYNERNNITRLIEEIFDEFPEGDVLVIDDGSPDRTANLVRERFGERRDVFLLERSGKNGLGSAYRHGLRWGMDREYRYFLTMDADFSHPPDRLSRIREALSEVDCVVGSRYISGGGIENWGWYRRLLSQSANFVARHCIGLPVRDCTSGFRGYRRNIINRVSLDRVQSEGYVFLVEMVTRVLWNGGTIREIPFTFVDRRVGQSKISRSEIFYGFLRVLQLMLESRLP